MSQNAAALRRYEIDAASGCWISTLTVNWRNGYPYGRPYIRFYESVHGPVPEDHHVHHVCRNRRCVNPEHLEALPKRLHLKLHHLDELGRTLEDVARARDDRRAGFSVTECAVRAGVPRPTMQFWLSQSWDEELGGPVVPDPAPRPCEHCGEPFKSTHPGRRFCKKKCQQAAFARLPEQRVKQRERNRRWLESREAA